MNRPTIHWPKRYVRRHARQQAVLYDYNNRQHPDGVRSPGLRAARTHFLQRMTRQMKLRGAQGSPGGNGAERARNLGHAQKAEAGGDK
ncbi:MAG TPA: hypothetical protein VGY99_01825 [Candidatus Binataceae bacterium]|jgi:hypothetical protein|nr:hypothetical protein [Candidatus Binataceae bacterium]